jgi:hypothetical protein
LPVQQGVVEKVAHDLGELDLPERHLDLPGGVEVSRWTTVSGRVGGAWARSSYSA